MGHIVIGKFSKGVGGVGWGRNGWVRKVDASFTPRNI